MKPLLKSLVLLFSIIGILSITVVGDSTVHKMSNRPLLIVGDDINYPPYSFIDKNGNPAGFNIELAKTVGSSMGYDVEFRLDEWSKTRKALENGEIDVISGMFRSPERESTYDFTSVHSITNGAIFTDKKIKLRSMDELIGQTVVVQKDDIVGEYLAQQNLGIQLVEVPTVSEALKKVADGTYKYAGLLKVTGLYTIKEQRLGTLKSQDLVLNSNDYCLAVKKDNEHLLLTINAGLEIAKATGDYQRIYEKWLGIYDKNHLASVIVSYSWLVFIILGIITTLFIWGITLKHAVNAKTTELLDANKMLQDHQEELTASNEEMEASLEEIIAIEQEVSRQKIHFEALFLHTPDAAVQLDQHHIVQNVNEKFIELFGYTLEEIKGHDLDDFVADKETLAEAKALTKTFLSGNDVLSEGIRYGKGHNPIEVSIKGIPVLYKSWAQGGYAIYSDITHRKSQERMLIHQRNHDDLTGLCNRRFFEEQQTRFDHDLLNAVSVITADVNGLKLTNDSLGVGVGDEMLIAFSRIFKEECGPNAVVARLGGDDFAAILPGTFELQAIQMLETIKKRCADIRISDLPLSVSFGWAERTALKEPIHDTLKSAEYFMNRHKLTEATSARGETIKTIIRTLHEKNKREEEHSQRVGILSHALGAALGVNERQLRELKTMGILHDIGKIAVDDTILNKTEQLTKEEFEQIKRHPEIGYRILSAVNDMAEMAEYVLSHHERWDGKGYPQGLRETEIPYLSRIIAVVDAYDAMTRNRSYRLAMTEEAALEELEKNAGSQFDPDIVRVFLERPDVRYSDIDAEPGTIDII